MKNTPITKNDGVKLVSDFHTTLSKHNTAQAQASGDFKVAGRKALYETLGGAFGSSLQLTADPVLLGQVCAHFKAKAPAVGENPHSAVVRMLWRKKVGNDWIPDKSAWKYGKAFRGAQALGWTAANFADNLDVYTLVVKKDGKDKTLKGLIALETFDTQEHGNPEAQATEQENRAAQAWMAKKQPSLASFSADLVQDAQDQQMANVVVQYDAASRSWHVRAVNQSDHDRAWATIAKPTLKAFDDWRKDVAIKMATVDLPPEGDALFEALAAHNSEMDSRNALVTLTNRLVGFETDGDFMWPTSSRDTSPVTTSADQDSAAA